MFVRWVKGNTQLALKHKKRLSWKWQYFMHIKGKEKYITRFAALQTKTFNAESVSAECCSASKVAAYNLDGRPRFHCR
jgi:hypothetical protein